MPESAVGLREQKMLDAATRLTDRARTWTVERGYTGFTIDELCECAAVSRRSFFNYFASKEDAVLGLPVRVDHRDVERRFSEGAGARGKSGLSATLMSDLAEMMISRWEAHSLATSDLVALSAAIEAAPRLLSRALQITREQEQHDIALVEGRENLAPGDLRAGTVVHLLGTILRGAVTETVAGTGHESLRIVFARRLAAARAVFAA